MLAGYLSHRSAIEAGSYESYSHNNGPVFYIAKVLTQEPVEVQWPIIRIFNIFGRLSKSLARNSDIDEFEQNLCLSDKY